MELGLQAAIELQSQQSERKQSDTHCGKERPTTLANTAPPSGGEFAEPEDVEQEVANLVS